MQPMLPKAGVPSDGLAFELRRREMSEQRVSETTSNITSDSVMKSVMKRLAPFMAASVYIKANKLFILKIKKPSIRIRLK